MVPLTTSLIKLTNFLNSGTVIVVEPIDNYRKTLRLYLNYLKVNTFKIYDSAVKAKEDFDKQDPSCFIVEWAHPQRKTNGLQFCREIRKNKAYEKIPFVLLATESVRSEVILASEVGIDALLLKPFSFKNFCDQLVLAVQKSKERIKAKTVLDKAEEALKKKDFKKAEKLFLECVLFPDNSARVQCGLGKVKLFQKQYDEAVTYFEQSIRVNNSYMEAYRCLVQLYKKSGQPHHSLHYAIKLHELSPNNPRYILVVAYTYLEINQLPESESFFRRVIAVSPLLAEGHKGLGDIHMLKEEYSQAMKCYEKALDIDHDDVAILNSMGLALVKQGFYEEGIKKYRLALNVEPSNAKVLFNIGYAFEKNRCPEEAQSYYNKALISEPDFDKPKRGIERIKKGVPPSQEQDLEQEQEQE